MNVKQLGMIVGVVSASVAAHGAVVNWGVRMRERLQREQEVSITHIVRQEVSPLREDIARAHARLDVHIQQHTQRAQ